MNSDSLCGIQVLVVEDEMLVAMMVEDMLSQMGCEVAATAGCLDDAMAVVESRTLDLAILDMNLNGVRTTCLADALAARGIPFVFATGYGERGIDAPHKGRPLLTKPFQERELSAAIARALSR